MDIIQLPTHLIDEDTDQPRYQFDEEALQELMSSIGELGLLSPIKVRTTPDGRYKIIYGNRRYKACRTLGLPTIPCIVSNVTDEMEIYLEQIAENLTRQGFSPIEEAEAFNKLLNDPKFSSSIKYMSGKLGKPESYIKNKLDLLKFSNAVRALIVYGTEIRKDKLTEDQLMPLKDLPMEYRDSLALIMAADEMPVPDVKRIAKLFKDKEISEATKGKLLFKTGPQLLETWSTFEHNKKERAKSAEPKEEVVKDMPESKERSPRQENSSFERPVGMAKDVAAVAFSAALMTVREEVVEDDEASTTDDQPSESFIEGMLNLLLGTLPAPTHLSPKDLPKLEGVERDQFVQDVDTLIGDLEKHLAEWRTVKDMMASQAK
ncbi:ParB/RepB/Spo0J family partition protein [Cohnella luojiensis]|uniref:ParB/RepB/Spo0J family partition protein n=1 Tax=Cohnella luojiensis TaxID=652876 RepID=A0A4Y8LQ47_9BACL|nr:ParB/RepB/Spo0J family partition protein [Cohnella luojiensis]TFE23360.1 ParB/RepB/Spo0J family partition protein [Cohnella luojiensis]